MIKSPDNPGTPSVATAVRVSSHFDGEAFVNWLFLAMASTVILLSLLMNTSVDQRVYLPGWEHPVPSMCSTKVLFGIDCPGCGLTRAFIAISHGEFARAWELNRASFLVYAFVFLQIPWHAVQLYRRYRGLRLWESNLVYLIPIAMVVALMVNWVFRLVEYFR